MKTAVKLLGWCMPVSFAMVISLGLARRFLPFELSNLSLLAPAIVLGVASYALRRRTALIPPCRPVAEFVPCFILSLGYIGSIPCFYLHLCMCGHMAHSSLVSSTDYLLDLAWALTVVASAYVAVRIHARSAFPICSFVIFLLGYRFGLRSFGGLFSVPI